MPAREPRSSSRLWKLVESVVLPLAIIALASGLRLWNLGQPDPKGYDEGVRLEQLYLMAAGFRPFHDISADQGPLLLEYFFPFFNSLGRDATAARAAVVVASLACLVATYLSARRLGGPIAGLGALAFLGLSPLFLSISRRAIAEAVALAPACLALWLALAYRANGRTPLALASAACYALAILLKPMALTVLVPITLVLVVRRGRLWLGDVLPWSLIVVGVAALAVAIIGPAALYEEFVTNRLLARSMHWTLEGNFRQVEFELQSDLPLLGLAAAAIWPLARAAPLYAAVATSWFATVVLLLLFHSPLWPKHVAYLLPPAALLAGGGLGAAVRLRRLLPIRSSLASLAPLLLALCWYGLSLPSTLEKDQRVISPDAPEIDFENDLADAIAFITRVTEPDEYLVTDHPHLAFLSNRRVPPRLVNPSYTRIASKALSDDDFIRETRAFQPTMVVFWSVRARLIRRFADWLESDYTLVRLYGSERAMYVRNNALSRVADVVPGRTSPDPVRFGDAIALSRVDLEPFGSGRDYLVTLAWHAVELLQMTPNYVAYLELRAPDGVRLRDREGLLPAWRSLAWPPGRSLVQRRWLNLTGLPTGEYFLTLRIARGPTGRPLSPSVEPSSHLEANPGASTVNLGRIVLN
jgi:hypothetical protein